MKGFACRAQHLISGDLINSVNHGKLIVTGENLEWNVMFYLELIFDLVLRPPATRGGQNNLVATAH